MTDVLPRLAYQPKSHSFDERRLSSYPRPDLADGEEELSRAFTTVLPNVNSDGYTLTSYASYIGDPRKLIVHYV